MIVAEHSDFIFKSHSANEKGGLPHNLGSYYGEHQIINNLGEEIYALDYRNQLVRILPQDGASVPLRDDRNITIQYRFTTQRRQFGHMSIEQTPSTRCRIVIPYNVLLREPVFVEELNAVLFSPRWHPDFIPLHPHSKEYLQKEHEKIRAEVARKATYSPITIMANDPTGKVAKLFVVVDGKICSIHVSHLNESDNETDLITIARREALVSGEDDVRLVRTSFTELYRQDPMYWEIDGLQICKDRDWLAHKLEIANTKAKDTQIPAEEVTKLVKEAREADQKRIKELHDTITDREGELKTVKARYGQLRDSYDDLIKNGHADRSSTIISRKLDLEEDRIEASIREAAIGKETEDIKKIKEQLSVAATVVKLAIAVVPLVLIYLKYKQSKS